MYLEYSKCENSFTWEELKHLASAMGFSKEVFEKNLPKDYTTDSDNISVKDFVKCIDERCFHVDLHYTGNLKSGAYNATCLKQAVYFVSKRFLSFKELLDVRLAFQAYEEYDQKGMKINEYTLLRCLKMCGRVISPKKLMHKVKHLKSSYKEQGRIQFFEFLDLLALCELLNKYHITYHLNSPVEKTWTQLYKVDNFKHFTIPKDKKLWKHLNKEYTEKELKYLHPELRSLPFIEYPLKMDAFRTQVKLSNSHYEMLLRSLRNSNKQVQLAKGGFSYMRPQTTTQKKDANRRAASSLTGIGSQATTPEGRMSTPGANVSSSAKPKRAQRPQSSPPVINAAVSKDSRTKVENVQFDICTENQRWSKHYLSNMKSHLPNYPEVLKRMVKTPHAPRRPRVYRRERPSPAVIVKLSNHETRPPVKHMERCDALTYGIGTDQHSTSLAKRAKKIRCKSAPAATSRLKSASSFGSKRKSKYSTLLESLMREYDYESGSDSSEAEEDFARVSDEIQCNADENPDTILSAILDEEIEKQTTDRINHEEIAEQTDEKLSADATHEQSAAVLADIKQDFIREFFKWKTDKFLHIKDFVENSGYYRTCINPSGESKRPLPSIMEEISSSHCPEDPELSQKPKEIDFEPPSDFEKYISEPKNLRIPHDALLVTNTECYYEKRRRLRSLKRIAQRYPVEDRRWFASLAQKKSTKILV